MKKSCRTAEESPSVLQDSVGLYGTLVTDSGGSVGFLQDYLWDLLVLWDSCGTICAGFRVLWDSYRNICVGLRFMRDSSRTCVGLPLWNLLRIDGDSGFLQQAFLSNYIIHILQYSGSRFSGIHSSLNTTACLALFSVVQFRFIFKASNVTSPISQWAASLTQ